MHGGTSAQSKLSLNRIRRGTLGTMGDCTEGHLHDRDFKMMKGHAEGHVSRYSKWGPPVDTCHLFIRGAWKHL
jgi:hypothetical protein